MGQMVRLLLVERSLDMGARIYLDLVEGSTVRRLPLHLGFQGQRAEIAWWMLKEVVAHRAGLPRVVRVHECLLWLGGGETQKDSVHVMVECRLDQIGGCGVGAIGTVLST